MATTDGPITEEEENKIEKLREKFIQTAWHDHQVSFETLKTKYRFIGSRFFDENKDKDTHSHVKRLEQYLSNHPDTQLPSCKSNCLCGAQIQENCYLIHEDNIYPILVSGNCCIRKFLGKETRKKTCLLCNKPHQNHKVTVCNDCRHKCLVCLVDVTKKKYGNFCENHLERQLGSSFLGRFLYECKNVDFVLLNNLTSASCEVLFLNTCSFFTDIIPILDRLGVRIKVNFGEVADIAFDSSLQPVLYEGRKYHAQKVELQLSSEPLQLVWKVIGQLAETSVELDPNQAQRQQEVFARHALCEESQRQRLERFAELKARLCMEKEEKSLIDKTCERCNVHFTRIKDGRCKECRQFCLVCDSLHTRKVENFCSEHARKKKGGEWTRVLKTWQNVKCLLVSCISSCQYRVLLVNSSHVYIDMLLLLNKVGNSRFQQFQDLQELEIYYEGYLERNRRAHKITSLTLVTQGDANFKLVCNGRFKPCNLYRNETEPLVKHRIYALREQQWALRVERERVAAEQAERMRKVEEQRAEEAKKLEAERVAKRKRMEEEEAKRLEEERAAKRQRIEAERVRVEKQRQLELEKQHLQVLCEHEDTTHTLTLKRCLLVKHLQLLVKFAFQLTPQTIVTLFVEDCPNAFTSEAKLTSLLKQEHAPLLVVKCSFSTQEQVTAATEVAAPTPLAYTGPEWQFLFTTSITFAYLLNKTAFHPFEKFNFWVKDTIVMQAAEVLFQRGQRDVALKLVSNLQQFVHKSNGQFKDVHYSKFLLEVRPRRDFSCDSHTLHSFSFVQVYLQQTDDPRLYFVSTGYITRKERDEKYYMTLLNSMK